MDTTKTITHLGLCAGYGGIELGLKRVIPNLRSVAFCEIEAFACANLVAKMEAGLMEPAPIWTDLKTFPWESFRDRVDILTGVYPCQPFSAAGKRLGTEDPRHLWPFIASGIRILRPKLCFFENVEGHISLGLREVIGDLGAIGYQAAWGIFSAREVGAPHQRKRVFILAYRKCAGLEGWISRMQPASNGCGTSSDISESSNLLVNSINNVWSDVCGVQHGETKQPIFSIASGDVANAMCNGSREGWLIRQGSDGAESVSDGKSWGAIELADTCHGSNPEAGYAEAHRLPSKHWQEVCSGFAGGANATSWPSRPGQQQYAWEPPRVVGTVPAKLANFCSRDSQSGGDTAQASGESFSERGEGEDSMPNGGSSLCGGDQGNEQTALADTNNAGWQAGRDHSIASSRGSGSHRSASHCGDQEPAGLEDSNGSGGAEGLAHAGSLGRGGRSDADAGGLRGEIQVEGSCGSGTEAMGNADHGRLASGINAGSGAEADRGGQGDIEQAESGQTQPPMGRDADGTAGGMDLSELSGISNQELAEICDWMVKTESRTDELRLLGNGVVPATATKAFLTLIEELNK